MHRYNELKMGGYENEDSVRSACLTSARLFELVKKKKMESLKKKI